MLLSTVGYVPSHAKYRTIGFRQLLVLGHWYESITNGTTLLRIIIGTETKPEDDKKPEEQKDFVARKGRSFSTIYLNVSKSYRCIIDDIEDPIEARECLEEHFKSNSRARIIGLSDEFLCRLNALEEIAVYAARIRSIVNQLNDAGRAIDE
ncbi:integrase catalytic domain-containing protein [Trichonephila clavipes]|nr:integrase catalytic domain-containing protein [Trichonephila clavipes]